MSYEYDWKYGRVTLNWLAPTVGLVRVHDDENEIPGPYNCVVSVVIDGDECELEGFCGKNPSISEYKAFFAHLESLGLRIKRRRFKGSSVGASRAI